MDSPKRVRAFFIDSYSFESARLISGEPVEWLAGLVRSQHMSRGIAVGKNGYWINVPLGNHSTRNFISSPPRRTSMSICT